uniref:Uncharacterized protein n=1 Tax=Glossina pallidipes TaxID=7398 RepID=A0A1A9ZG49_GLOPL
MEACKIKIGLVICRLKSFKCRKCQSAKNCKNDPDKTSYVLAAKDLAGMIPLMADAASYAPVQKSLHTRSPHNRNTLPNSVNSEFHQGQLDLLTIAASHDLIKWGANILICFLILFGNFIFLISLGKIL